MSSLAIPSSASLPSSRRRRSPTSWWKSVLTMPTTLSSNCRCAASRSFRPLANAGCGGGAAPMSGRTVLNPRMSTNRSQLAPLARSAASRTRRAPREAYLRSLSVRIISSIPSALRKRCWFSGSAREVVRQPRVFSISSASSKSAGSRRLNCDAATRSERMPSSSPSSCWFSECCCSSSARISAAYSLFAWNPRALSRPRVHAISPDLATAAAEAGRASRMFSKMPSVEWMHRASSSFASFSFSMCAISAIGASFSRSASTRDCKSSGVASSASVIS
mmetsp:Transcript_5513/g.14076  ORF Transcript_5513/g.14076 Transcript_5513/m.14076 type:complete len:277 (-) Transcript_5513:194-1024(-)